MVLYFVEVKKLTCLRSMFLNYFILSIFKCIIKKQTCLQLEVFELFSFSGVGFPLPPCKTNTSTEYLHFLSEFAA